jgi:hypothetical protein
VPFGNPQISDTPHIPFCTKHSHPLWSASTIPPVSVSTSSLGPTDVSRITLHGFPPWPPVLSLCPNILTIIPPWFSVIAHFQSSHTSKIASESFNLWYHEGFVNVCLWEASNPYWHHHTSQLYLYHLRSVFHASLDQLCFPLARPIRHCSTSPLGYNLFLRPTHY